jgi:molecular chaperone GrpE
MQSSPANEGGIPELTSDEPGKGTEDRSEEIRELESRLAGTEDRYKRALADLDNFRKRSVREAERRALEVRESVLREWLEAVDSVERALRQHPEGPLHEGLRAVLDQMDSILDRAGVVRIGEVGERFDPERHEAVAVRDSEDAPDGTVVEVARSGFALGERVLRPAQVVVARREQRAP